MGSGQHTAGRGGDFGNLDGLRITIVHYGEDVPIDDGYRPIRYGQLAEWLIQAGVEVTRIAPTFSHLTHRQRPLSLSGTPTDEGRIELVPTPGYRSNRGLERLRFLARFRAGVAEALDRLPSPDLCLIGYPPPGLVWSARRVLGSRSRIVADIRDLWPDAQIPARLGRLARIGAVVGRGLATELRAADGVVAMSARNLGRAPAHRRIRTIPLSISDRLATAPNPVLDGPLRVVFVGTLTPLFDFESMLAGWGRFRAGRPAPGGADRATLGIVGDGPLVGRVERLVADLPGVELVGRIPSEAVPEALGRADVGVVPLRAGQGGTLTNKVLEYLGTGAYVAHTLDPDVARELDGAGLRVAPDAASWRDAFAELDGRVADLRAGRSARRRRSIDRFGRGAVEGAWRSTLVEVLSGELTPGR